MVWHGKEQSAAAQGQTRQGQTRQGQSKNLARGSGAQPVNRPHITKGRLHPPEELTSLVQDLAMERRVGAKNRPPHHARAMWVLAEAVPPEALVDEVERLALLALRRVWKFGWQPREVVRQAKRNTTEIADLTGRLIVAEHQKNDPAGVDPRWQNQIDTIVAAVSKTHSPGEQLPHYGWLQQHLSNGGALKAFTAAEVSTLIEFLSLLATQLGRVNRLIPPPGGTIADTDNPRHDELARNDTDDPVLEKIRALLAQAESTDFAAEAETFTAKAQQLMTRHAIDGALIEARFGDATRSAQATPIFARLDIDDPYADEKFFLLSAVAQANRCRAIFAAHYGSADLVGFAEDVTLTDVLFTSLLVQAQAALLEHARGAPAGSRTRSRSFRSSFLRAYSSGIAVRLEEAHESVVSEMTAEEGGDFLPVLASRLDDVNNLIEDHYDNLGQMSQRGGTDYLGHRAGSAAADSAVIELRDSTLSDNPKPSPDALGSPTGR